MHHASAVLRRAAFRRGAAALTFVALTAGTALTGAPAATAAGSTALAGKACTPTEGFSGCRLFLPSEGKQGFEVPSGVTSLDVRAWGEGGAGNSMTSGGAGGFVAGTLKVSPGEALSLAVAGLNAGDALGGKGGNTGAERGGNSSGIRTSTGSALVIAGGGGGGGGDMAHGQAGAAGGESGQDASEAGRGGKGATGAKGGAGTGNGAAGADHAKGGAGGTGGAGRYAGGGGGAGYAGGGGGTGAETGSSTGNDPTTGSGGGGSSYAEPARVDDARFVVGSGYKAPEKTDPFWADSDNPIDSGVAEGGVNAPGGPGRIVLQWRGLPVDRLAQVSGTDVTTQPGHDVKPLAVVARGKDGKPVADASVTYTIEDPDGLKPLFYLTGGPDDDETVVATDAQGRAQSPWINLSGGKEGSFTVRAETLGASTAFTVRVKESPYVVSAAAGDKQKTEQGQDFADALLARVVKSGKTAPAGTEVEFRVEDTAEDAPRFEGEDRVVRVKTDDSGEATAPALTAGEGTGTYTVAASVGDAMTQFAVEVVPGDGSEEPGPGDESGSPSPSPTTDPSPTAEPSPSATGTGTAGTTGGDGTSTTGGTSTDLDGGSLASTGAGGMGLVLATAAALAAVGFAAFRFAPRLKLRSRDNA
ncbi:hypothetical protein [Streptomyces variegatus]|uniref:glycine-rich domain-containing protein n=1 Tax=Streptomyces variegatus TaxID=284040 RepID=UPI003C2F81A8